MTKVLLVEDDHAVADIIASYLTDMDEYEVTRAETAEHAMSLCGSHFDVILLDVMLPDASGIDVCAKLREGHDCPILFVSCVDDTDAIVAALANGGDDYIVKPFNNVVLHARIQANLRRVRMDANREEKRIQIEGIELEAKSRSMTVRGKTYVLGNMEYLILSFLMENAGSYYTSGELYRKLWGKPSFGDARTVLVHIHNLRKKLEEDPSKPTTLVNVPGRGYTFVCESMR